MTTISNHIRREIRATGVESCAAEPYATAHLAVQHIQAMHQSRRHNWFAAHCCRCRSWHVQRVVEGMRHG